MSGVTDASAVITARALGEAAGTAAASWVFDGNTTLERYQRSLKMIEDGDPALDDYITEPWWLGGIWAGDPTPSSLAEDLGIDPTLDSYLLDECCTAYETAASDKFWVEVQAFAQRMVEDWA
jgi:hypothetical protein